MNHDPIDLVEWQTATPATVPALRGVTLLADPRIAQVIERLAQQSMLSVVERRDGLSVSSTSFVGSLTLGPVTIRVRPKIGPGLFATLIGYGFHLHNLKFFSDHDVALSAPAFQNLLVRQLCDEAARLMARGLAREYTCLEESLPIPRGRIAFSALARRPLDRSALPCRHYVRTDNAFHNRVLLSGLTTAASVCSDVATRGRALRLASQLGVSISPVRLGQLTFSMLRRRSTRLTAAYDAAVALIRLLLAGQGVSLGPNGETVRLPGFLFDMNLLFQEVVGRFLSDWVAGGTLDQQYRLRNLFSYEPDHNPRRRQSPCPRPDFVLRVGTRIAAILDAKYRDLWDEALPSAMLYQLTAYALSQASCSTATILYPSTSDAAREARISVQDPFSGVPRGCVALRPVPLRTLAELATAPRTLRLDRERQRFASYLVGG